MINFRSSTLTYTCLPWKPFPGSRLITSEVKAH